MQHVTLNEGRLAQQEWWEARNAAAPSLHQTSEECPPLVVVDGCGTGDSDAMREDRNGSPKRRRNDTVDQAALFGPDEHINEELAQQLDQAEVGQGPDR